MPHKVVQCADPKAASGAETLFCPVLEGPDSTLLLQIITANFHFTSPKRQVPTKNRSSVGLSNTAPPGTQGGNITLKVLLTAVYFVKLG